MESEVDVLATRVANALEPRREVLEAYLFGSHERGEGHPHSDVDIAVFIDKESARSGLFGYQSELTADPHERPSHQLRRRRHSQRRATPALPSCSEGRIDAFCPAIYRRRQSAKAEPSHVTATSRPSSPKSTPTLRAVGYIQGSLIMTPGQVDVRIITRHLAPLREALRVLSQHSDTPIESLEADAESAGQSSEDSRYARKTRSISRPTLLRAGVEMYRITRAPSTSSDASEFFPASSLRSFGAWPDSETYSSTGISRWTSSSCISSERASPTSRPLLRTSKLPCRRSELSRHRVLALVATIPSRPSRERCPTAVSEPDTLVGQPSRPPCSVAILGRYARPQFTVRCCGAAVPAARLR